MVGVWKYAKTRLLPQGGVNYRVYAPNARTVAVLINDQIALPLKKYDDGIWSIDHTNGEVGDSYYFLINGTPKVDPTAECSSLYKGEEFSPRSVVYESTHGWQDSSWLARRSQKNYDKEPLLIYEVHIGAWGEGTTYRSLAEELPKYIHESGYNAVQFLPLQEHFLELSWGYMATSWFAPASRYGTPDDLKYLIDTLHQHDIPVIFDLLVFHFPKDPMALANFDGTPLFEYETTLPNFAHDVWGTEVLGFNKQHVRDFLLTSLDYWLGEFHFDGVRLDALTDMIDMSLGIPKGQDYYPGADENDGQSLKDLVDRETGGIKAIRGMVSMIHEKYPGVIAIGEDGGGWRGTTKSKEEDPDFWLGFDFKYAMATSWIGLPNYFMQLEADRSREVLYQCLEMDQDQKRVYQLCHDETTHLGKGSIFRSLGVSKEELRVELYKTLLMYYIALPGKKVFYLGIDWGNYNAWNGDNNEHHPPLPSDLSTKYLYRNEIDYLPEQGQIHSFFKKLANTYQTTKDLYTTDNPEGAHMSWVVACEKDYLVLQRGEVACVFNFSESEKEIPCGGGSVLLSSTNLPIKVEAGTITMPATSGVYLTT